MSVANRLSALVAAIALVAAPAATLFISNVTHADEAVQAAAPAETAAPADAAAPAAPAVADAATVAAPAGDKVEVENPYGLEALWAQGDFIAKGTLVIMIIMSMGTWYILVTKLWEQTKLLRQARAARESFWSAGSIKSGVETLQEGSAFRFIAESAIKASEHHEGALLEQIDRNTWVTMSIQRSMESVQNRLQDGLAFLATVGSTAPFIGLFGTVWGIYHALVAIGMSGQASIDKVAGPVGESLIMTAIGLAVAVPAVLGYNWLVRRNKGGMEQVRAFGADLHSVVLAGDKNKRG
ncbi:outer membrane transport energization protein ExbB (TC 2.C.1.1.1) [Chitinimonas taiwanensis DSM 18899]|uniref:Biopolymer transport protein ExbB n=1 Tax=Chitinimonas taiwanensis DSM 18899 TaxID=1121279 RepID=A0A1K2HE50_9NEIS|nr:outer membrane transport energization protein ExbB (TC 2.C.1.1.1) [Chitinimonas taiwanensis DSM 18899]